MVTKGSSIPTHVLSLGVDVDEAITGLLLAESIGDVLSNEIVLPVEPFWCCIRLFMLERRLKNQLINLVGSFNGELALHSCAPMTWPLSLYHDGGHCGVVANATRG